MTAVLETTSLTKTFATRSNRAVRALDDAPWRVGCGEIIGLLGTNGAGKTTLIDLLLGLTRPATGEVRLFGDPRISWPRRCVACTPGSGS